MGNRKSPQGHSLATGPKQALISMCVGWTLRYVQPKHGRFCVFDHNGGLPFYIVANRRYRGTTQTVLDKLETAGQRSSLWWCDKDQHAATALEAFIPQNGHLFGEPPAILVHVIRGDNATFAASIPQRISEIGLRPATARGVVIADPNGLDVPLDAIGASLRQAPHLDVIIHLSSFKQVWAYWDKHADAAMCRETGERVGSFRDIFTALPKSSWLISEPFRPESGHGRDHVVLYGSNLWNVPPIQKYGLPAMHRTDSADGIRLLNAIDRVTVLDEAYA